MVHRRRSGDRLFRPAARRTAQPAADGFRLLRAGALPSTASVIQASGYDGIGAGADLRVRRGEELRVRLVNDLAAPTSVHWHGIRLPNAMDGVPAADPASRWHPARASITAFGRPTPARSGTTPMLPARPIAGLAGALIVEDAQPVDVDRDIALVLTASRCGRRSAGARERIAPVPISR